ncbi:MAG: carbon monoxide dehydrogenase [Streptosporangiales bacterium]|nr:carbon monoxide dehydrogenase [Streptosporangiales bacterium]
MVMAPFDYVRADSFADAVRLLAEHGEEAKLLAGGQSLLPMLNLRLARPSVLIDISAAAAEEITLDGDRLRVPALTRHRDLAASPLVRRVCPMLSEAAGLIGNPRVRNLGTIGGSLAHADPAAELPAVMLALSAEIEATGPDGTRRIPAADFFTSYFTTVLDELEVVTAVHLPVPGARTAGTFTELTRRAGDFAVAGVAAVLTLDPDGTVGGATLALCGMAERPVRAEAAERALLGAPATPATYATAARAAVEGLDPPDDVQASGAYRVRVAEVLTRRALTTAAAQAERGAARAGNEGETR